MSDYAELDAMCCGPECDRLGEHHIDVRDGGTLGMLCQEHLDNETVLYAQSALMNLRNRKADLEEAEAARGGGG